MRTALPLSFRGLIRGEPSTAAPVTLNSQRVAADFFPTSDAYQSLGRESEADAGVLFQTRFILHWSQALTTRRYIY